MSQAMSRKKCEALMKKLDRDGDGKIRILISSSKLLYCLISKVKSHWRNFELSLLRRKSEYFECEENDACNV